jgi:hypothetical protein
MCRGSSVSRVTGYELENEDLTSSMDSNFLFTTQYICALQTTQPLLQRVAEVLPEEKWPKHEADNSLLPSAKVKNA